MSSLPAPPPAQQAAPSLPSGQRWAWLPPIGSWRYYLLLGLLGSLVLGPLGGITASYMNFSIGFFVGGQVLAGILGSTVTFGYGPEGKHGANYMQTAAASVAGMAGMGVLLQAMLWMGLPRAAAVAAGALHGRDRHVRRRCRHALHADPGRPAAADLSVRPGGGQHPARAHRPGAAAPLGGAAGQRHRPGRGGRHRRRQAGLAGAIELSTSTLGAGMLVGARIGIPALVASLTGTALIPWFVSIGWLGAGEPYRKITFLLGLGMIMGAALLDIGGILLQAAARWRNRVPAEPAVPEEAWKRTHTGRLLAWTLFWAVAVIWLGAELLHQPVFFMAFAVALVFVFTMVNGISLGISDSNPISSAFVVSVVLMAALGLKDPTVGLMAGAILLVATSVAGDMQQDRSTGWRLGTPRTIQFRFQVLGLVVGAVMTVAFARLFIGAYPVLALDQTTMPADQQPAQWASAMTYKFVGALRSLTDDKPYQRTAIWVGVGIGFAVQVLRLMLFRRPAYQRWRERSGGNRAADFALDAVLLPSPYAYSFGTFLGLATSAWFAAGGVISSARGDAQRAAWPAARGRRPAGGHEHQLADRRRADRG
jgi:hypothetical protein